jgi:transposase
MQIKPILIMIQMNDPKPENETVLKLRLASWMWFSGQKRRRRDARETTQRKAIVYALRQVEGGKKVSEVCREMGVSQQAFYSWRRRYAGLGLLSHLSYAPIAQLYYYS